VVEDGNGLPALRVRVELRPGRERDAAFEDRVRRALAGSIRVTADLELLPFGTLPRADARAKKRRVVRRHA
jgi:phenylacetate-coenzyme A ligase PaaK-like adenylate-forming protein